MHSWTFILRRLCLALAVLSVAGVAHAELGDGSNSAACCQLTTSLINDVLRGKDVAGDERFFATDGAPPNIHFLIDTSGSMQELPQLINSDHYNFLVNLSVPGECINPRLDAFSVSRGWNPAHVYPVPDPGTGTPSDPGFNELFLDNKYYAYHAWGYSSAPPPAWNSAEEACKEQIPNWNGAGSAEFTKCMQCLATKGYFKTTRLLYDPDNPATRAFILWGRFLNFNPPKYVTAKAVLKSVIKEIKRARVSMSHFLGNSPYSRLVQPPGLTAKTNPSCSAIIENADAFDSDRNYYIASVNGLAFEASTPLARSLINAGYYFTSSESVYRTQFAFGDTGYFYPTEFKNELLSSQFRSVCWGCQTSSIIIITDGEPNNDELNATSKMATLPATLRTLNGGPVYCPDSAPCGNGIRRDHGTNNAVPDTNYTNDLANYYLDDVAKLLHDRDLQSNDPPQVDDFNTAGKQSVNVYTVGFGINSNLLKHTAEVGGGLYFSADDAASLKQALTSILGDVVTRATSFSSPAAASLQLNAASSTLIPRFKPSRSASEPWQGTLYRFNMGPERLLGCDPRNPAAKGDLNGDGDCEDTHLVDAEGDAVIENDEGSFVKFKAPLTAAKPFWEAGEKLRPANALNPTRWKTRRIYTMVDSNGDNRLDFRDTPVEFSEDNATLLRPYLGIPNHDAPCPDLVSRLGVTSLTPDECAKVLIRWYRGADALNPDPAKRDYDRKFLLHDIFHSSPVPADPPVPASLCSFDPDCLNVLIGEKTEQENTYSAGTRTGVRAYDKYHFEAGDRDRVVLVGSNGGMLHAFHNGKSTGAVDIFTGQYKYDDGTGEELWAFVPPDLLPKLRPNIGKHAYFVDGSPMLRSVWLDGVGGPSDGKKQWEEFRKVAIVGTGRGGVHRFALDLTRLLGEDPGDSEGRKPDTAGDFLWMWPQPCDALSIQVGEGFSNFSPKPPPIGPVALSPEADDAVRALYGVGGGAVDTPWNIQLGNTPKPARERWVVGFNGGFDQSMTRGRGFAIVDVRTGHTLWSFFNNDGQANAEHLRYPISAGMSLMDLGPAQDGDATGNIDYLWDSGTVGDYGGQLWMLRMYDPGEWDSTTQKVKNWYAARAFRVDNTAGKSSQDEAIRAPITFQTLNAVDSNNAMHVFVGTGDRENLLEKGSVCRLSNPLACASQGCAVNTKLTVERGGSQALTSTASFADFTYDTGQMQPATGALGNACLGARVELAWTNTADNSCENDTDGRIEYTCDGNATTWNCRETANTWTALNYAKTSQTHPQRFYGLKAYARPDGRYFDTKEEALDFDTGRYDDQDLTELGGFNEETGKTEGAQGKTADGSKGWYIQYLVSNERTGTSGAIVNGCVLWNSFEPSGAPAAVCSTTGTNVARLYQAHYSSGMANCAVGFYGSDNRWSRFIEMNTVAAPPEPAPQISLGGGLSTSGIVLQGAGVQMSQTVDAKFDSSKSLYQLELDYSGHDCRHNVNGNCDPQ